MTDPLYALEKLADADRALRQWPDVHAGLYDAAIYLLRISPDDLPDDLRRRSRTVFRRPARRSPSVHSEGAGLAYAGADARAGLSARATGEPVEVPALRRGWSPSSLPPDEVMAVQSEAELRTRARSRLAV
jgi:hypothetical protein